jgi:hypothetical protein
MPRSCVIGMLRNTSSDAVGAINLVQVQALEWGGRLGGREKEGEDTRDKT